MTAGRHRLTLSVASARRIRLVCECGFETSSYFTGKAMRHFQNHLDSHRNDHGEGRNK